LAGSGPEGFFEGEKAETLDECTLDLTVVDGWVDRLTYVLHVVLAFELGVSNRCIYLPS
jgi:hypothetical protein